MNSHQEDIGRCIAVRVHDRSGTRIVEIHQRPTIIGRSSTADVTVEDSWVSRIHCQIERTGDGVTCRDLESRNGMLFNGELVQTCRLGPGEQARIGAFTVIEFAQDDSAAQSTGEK